MDIGMIRMGGCQPSGLQGAEMPQEKPNAGFAGRDSLSVGTSRANPLAEAPVDAEVEADLRRDDDLGRLFSQCYDYPAPELKLKG